MVLNVEWRAPLFGGFGVVGFADAGNVFARTSDINLGELRTALEIPEDRAHCALLGEDVLRAALARHQERKA